MTTAIEWADEVWNPVTGCTKVSAGCKHCYAERLHMMRHQAYLAGKALPAQYAQPFEVVQLHPERLSMPAHWKRPRKIFVNSMSDLFHEDVPVDYIANVFAVMALEDRHIYIVATKRAKRMYDVVTSDEFAREYMECIRILTENSWTGVYEPLPNVWLLVSVENQQAADERVPYLLHTPAAVRGVSVEPMLGPVDFVYKKGHYETNLLTGWMTTAAEPIPCPSLDWVICGGETGPDARPMNVAWARALRDQCRDADVPFFYKRGGQGQGRELDGVRYEQFPV